MSDRDFFQGFSLSAIDGKGRVAMPSAMRQAVEKNSGEERLVIAKHPKDPCLIGYGRDHLENAHQRLEARDGQRVAAGEEQDFNAKRRTFALTEVVPFDKSGRFVMPEFFAARAKLDDLAMFIGLGDTFEIWNPEVAIATDGVDPEIKDAAEWLLSKRKPK